MPTHRAVIFPVAGALKMCRKIPQRSIKIGPLNLGSLILWGSLEATGWHVSVHSLPKGVIVGTDIQNARCGGCYPASKDLLVFG